MYMVSPISSAHASYANQVSTPAARQPQPQPQSSTGSSLPQDTVSLKSTGDRDHDGDSK
jgi:hypothetical protein